MKKIYMFQMPDIEILDSDDESTQTAVVHVGKLPAGLTVQELRSEIDIAISQVSSVSKLLNLKILHDTLTSENLQIGLLLLELTDESFNIDELAFELESYTFSQILNKQTLNVVLDSSRLGFENVRVVSNCLELVFDEREEFESREERNFREDLLGKLLKEELFKYLLGRRRFTTMVCVNTILMENDLEANSRTGFKINYQCQFTNKIHKFYFIFDHFRPSFSVVATTSISRITNPCKGSNFLSKSSKACVSAKLKSEIISAFLII